MRGESRAHLLPPGAAAARAAGALRPAPLAGDGTRDLLCWDFPLTSPRSRAGLGEGRGGGQGWPGRLRCAAPGESCRPSRARVTAPREPRKLQRALRRGSEVSRRDCDPQHQPGTRSGRAGIRRRVAASAGALPAPAAAAAAASASPSPSSIPTCRSPAGHPSPWAGAGLRRRPPHGCGCEERGSGAGGSRRGGGHCLPGSQPRVPLSEPRWCLLRAAVPQPVRRCLPPARCLTDPFLPSAGRAELQPLLTLYSGFLERLCS